MKTLLSFVLLFIIGASCFAQKQTFGAITYIFPNGWQQKEANGGRQLSVVDNNTGEYATVLVIKQVERNGSAAQHFDYYWNNIVKPSVSIADEPTVAAPVHNNGWEIISGYAVYKEKKRTGRATLLSATAGDNTTAVVLMSNTNKFEYELNAFIESLEIADASTNNPLTTQPATIQPSTSNSITGLWADYAVEKNAYNQYSTGYLRKEYHFNADGTYTFRKKNFLANSTDIYFVTESGTYTVNGNQLTLMPTQGKAGFWSKSKSLKNNEWGSFVKPATHKLEKLSYTFEILEDPNYGNTIILKPGKATARDGGQFNAPGDPYKFNYAFRRLESLIDDPPAWK